MGDSTAAQLSPPCPVVPIGAQLPKCNFHWQKIGCCSRWPWVQGKESQEHECQLRDPSVWTTAVLGVVAAGVVAWGSWK